MNTLKIACCVAAFAPLVGASWVGLLVRHISRKQAHWITNLGVGIAFFASMFALYVYQQNPQTAFFPLYEWGVMGGIPLHIGFQIDGLTLMMMTVVTFVSWMVHLYTIDYMHDDPGYNRFFAYISLFTFSMLMLVMSDNFLQLFFGWEAVGLVSYLLIGFWFKKPSATYANLKAFLVNRVGDLGFLLGIAGVFMVFGTLNYTEVFAQLDILNGRLVNVGGVSVSFATVIAILLFIGAMGKSAQVPLHVWLPDSMEGPTPISALIHAATMVTAGIFMVARLSPLFELSEAARTFMLVIGATTALFMGFLGLVQNDIKRIIAYSTLSQLGYMVVALGASAYLAGVFHLMTHAFFKALLFLCAGSVIMAMHHEQDIRKMGGLWRKMPITYVTALLATLALCGIPPFSGFYSKDIIIEAVLASHLPGAAYAQWALLIGVVVTAFYSFRLLFLVFHTQPRMDAKTASHVHECGKVVTVPLMLLAVPSVLIGACLVYPMVFAKAGFLSSSVFVLPQNNVLGHLAEHFHGAVAFALHAPMTLPFWLALTGIAAAYLCYEKFPAIPARCTRACSGLMRVFDAKYGFDAFNSWFFVRGAQRIGDYSWRVFDLACIDGVGVNGSAALIARIGALLRTIQTGFLNQYVFYFWISVWVFVTWMLFF